MSYIHTMIFLSMLKKDYLELCLKQTLDPDQNFLSYLHQAEASMIIYQKDHDLIKNFDLSLVQVQHIRLILQILKCQDFIEQIVVTAQTSSEIHAELTHFLDENQVDLQIKKRIPQLDLHMISQSSGNLLNSATRIAIKSPSQVHVKYDNTQFNTDRIQQVLQSERLKVRNQQSISPITNTKTVNLSLKQVEQKPRQPIVQKKSQQYLSSTKYQTKQNLVKNNKSITQEKKLSQHSFQSKHAKNTSSSPLNHDSVKRQPSIYAQKSNASSSKSIHIPIKTLLDSQQINQEFISKKISERPRIIPSGFKAQLNQIVNSERQLNSERLNSERMSTHDKENVDISLHLKNLINFCNQSIQKKDSSKRRIEVKLSSLAEEDEIENPETARFNSEEDAKIKSKGLQKLLQMKTSPNSERTLMNIFKR